MMDNDGSDFSHEDEVEEQLRISSIDPSSRRPSLTFIELFDTHERTTQRNYLPSKTVSPLTFMTCHSLMYP